MKNDDNNKNLTVYVCVCVYVHAITERARATILRGLHVCSSGFVYTT